MPRIDRRRLLKLSGAGALTAGTGGLAGILASGRAPAFAQGTNLHWLKFVDFVPVSDQLLKGKIKDACQKALGINAHHRDHQRRRHPGADQFGDPVQGRTRHHDGDQQLGAALRRKPRRCQRPRRRGRQGAGGGFFQTSRDIAYDGKRWIAMPFTILGVLFANRTSWFADVGVTPDKFPATWDEYRAIGKQMKAKDHPYGRRSPMPSVTGRRSGIPICGRGAARRSRPTARPSR